MSRPSSPLRARCTGTLLIPAVAFAALAGCGGAVSLYEPKYVAQHELTLRYGDGFEIYDGKRLLTEAPRYQGLHDFVRCVPRAAEHAQMAEDDGASAVGTGIAGGVLGVMGLGGLVGLGFLDRDDTTAFAIMGTGLAVGLLGVSLAIVSRSMKNSANGHAVDALNYYNDAVGSRGYSCAKPPPARPPKPAPEPRHEALASTPAGGDAAIAGVDGSPTEVPPAAAADGSAAQPPPVVEQPAQPAAPPAVPADRPMSVAALLATPDRGLWLVEARVSWVSTCPPCPPNAKCAPCKGDRAGLSDSGRRGGPDEIVVQGEAVASWQPGATMRVYLSPGSDGRYQVNRRRPPQR